MRIKKISGDEVTVYLNSNDLEYFNFHVENGIPDEGDLNSFLFDLMELVQTETGFDPYNGGRVMVEAIHTAHGMRLNICRIGKAKREKLTREQFKKVKRIRVREKSRADEISVEEYDELVRMIRDLGTVLGSLEAGQETFVLDGFNTMERALCRLNDEELENCVLYRDGTRYAIVSKGKSGKRIRTVLNEFADISHGGDILADDINEGWTEVVRGNKLIEMARALRDMQ